MLATCSSLLCISAVLQFNSGTLCTTRKSAVISNEYRKKQDSSALLRKRRVSYSKDVRASKKIITDRAERIACPGNIASSALVFFHATVSVAYWHDHSVIVLAPEGYWHGRSSYCEG